MSGPTRIALQTVDVAIRPRRRHDEVAHISRRNRGAALLRMIGMAGSTSRFQERKG
jgi:hypothetical protein